MARREKRQAMCRGNDKQLVPATDDKAAPVAYGEDGAFQMFELFLAHCLESSCLIARSKVCAAAA